MGIGDTSLLSRNCFQRVSTAKSRPYLPSAEVGRSKTRRSHHHRGLYLLVGGFSLLSFHFWANDSFGFPSIRLDWVIALFVGAFQVVSPKSTNRRCMYARMSSFIRNTGFVFGSLRYQYLPGSFHVTRDVSSRKGGGRS